MAKNDKIKENALTKCDRCDCLILSDSSNSQNDKCIHLGDKNYSYQNYKKSTSSNNADGDNVKITVQTQRLKCDETETSSTSASLSVSSSCSRHLHTDFSMKHICFRLSRKKKDNKDNLHETVEKKMTDDANQTSEVTIPEGKGDETETKTENTENKSESAEKKGDSEPSVEELIRKYCLCCKPPTGAGGGGCNTNAIIIPGGKMSGDNFTKLEDFIKTEIRSSDRKVEEILNELYRQRRELRDLKDMVQTLARTVQQQMFMKNGKNGFHEIFEDLCKRNCKSRTQSGSSTSANGHPTLIT